MVDYQDLAYGEEYLDILKNLHGIDRDCAGGEKDYLFTTASAKYLANAMTYDDVIRVADLKTRASRRERIEREMSLGQDQVLLRDAPSSCIPAWKKLPGCCRLALAGGSKRGLACFIGSTVASVRAVGYGPIRSTGF